MEVKYPLELKYFLEIIKEERDLILLVWYGSRLSHSDLDLLMILRRPENCGAKFGKIDLLVFGLKDFKNLLLLRDPLVTEPLLEGIPLIGESSFFGFRALLEMPYDREKVVEHLLKRSGSFLYIAESFLNDSQLMQDTQEMLALLNIVSSSIMAYRFATVYRKGKRGAIPYKAIRYQKDVLGDFELCIKTNIIRLRPEFCNVVAKPPTVEEMGRFVCRWREYLLSTNGH